MRFSIIDPFGCALSFAVRLRDEGHEVKLYIDKGKGRERSDLHAHVGEGIVDLENDYAAITSWASAVPDSLVLFAGSGLGDKADELRDRGLIVVGGGTFCDRLENDRLFGQKVAEEAGAFIPPFEEFNSLAAVKKRAKTLDKCVFFKSDRYIKSDATHQCETGEELALYINELREDGVPDGLHCILQEKIDGTPLSTLRWFNGRSFTGPWEWTIEHKAFMNGEVGPSTGCAINAVWFTDESSVADKLGWENLASTFREEDAPPGPYDINAVIDPEGTPYFLEWTSRFGYDADPTAFKLLDDFGGWLWHIGTGEGGAEFSRDLAVATRISCSPYPWEEVHWNDKVTCVGLRITGTDGLWDGSFTAYQVRQSKEGVLEAASPEGILGLAVAVGDSLSELNDEAVEFAKSLRPRSLQFRTDAAKVIKEDAEHLQDAGINVHPGLLK